MEWCRIIDQPAEAVIVVVTETSLHVIRLRPKPGTGLRSVGERIYMGIDHDKREVVQDILICWIRDLSNSASVELPVVIQQITRTHQMSSFNNFSTGLAIYH